MSAIKKWTDAAFAKTVEKYPTLNNRSEATAMAVWFLEQNPEMTLRDFEDMEIDTGVVVKGRALGGAREILGLSSGQEPATKKGPRKRKQAVTQHDMLSVAEQYRVAAEAIQTLQKVAELIAPYSKA